MRKRDGSIFLGQLAVRVHGPPDYFAPQVQFHFLLSCFPQSLHNRVNDSAGEVFEGFQEQADLLLRKSGNEE
jgi:hypothetical protein